MQTSRAKLLLVLGLAALFINAATAQKPTIEKNKVIVVLDNLAIRDSHSIYFRNLEEQGFKLEYKHISQDIKLIEFGEYLYDQMIFFAASENEPKNLKVEKILDFFDSGHNIIFAADVDISKTYRNLANALGVEFDGYGSRVYDGTHTFQAKNFVADSAFHDVAPGQSISYKGIGMSLTTYENFQVYPFIRGNEFTYSRLENPGGSKILSAGKNVILGATIQGRNNARAFITGSLEMFSNELSAASRGNNEIFVEGLTQWAFQLRGVLRVDGIFHHFANDNTFQPHEYKVYDDIVYNADISTYDHKTGKWVPYVADDLQLEFVMLDPYIRTGLKNVKGTSRYSVGFRAPDKYGVFQFKVTYRRPGYTFLNLATKITVRPFKHNEYERFLFEAYPYYATVFASLAGFVIFVIYFLLDKDTKGKGKKDKTD